jgi:hypothetical protein
MSSKRFENVPFTTPQAARCMLGKLSRNILLKDNVLSWTSRNKNHVIIINDEVTSDVIKRLNEIKSANFHYLSESSLNEISNHFLIKKNRGWSVLIDWPKSLNGKKNRRFRNYMNKYKDLVISENLKRLSDLEKMIKKWSISLGSKYFRDMSGKNLYFVFNDWHKDCDCLFIYDRDDLVSFGITSPVTDGKSSYIIGKALSFDYPGLADYTDIRMYQLLHEKYGAFKINLGQGSGGLLKYKMKFPGSFMQEHFHGSFVK